MNKSCALILGALTLFIQLKSYGQNEEARRYIESIVESRKMLSEPNSELDALVEDLEYLMENPISINHTNRDELSGLHLLSELQIDKLLNYIEKYGPVYSIYELQSIDGFSKDLLQKMNVFIYIGPDHLPFHPLKKELKYRKHQLLLRSQTILQKSSGYRGNMEKPPAFQGDPYRYYLRYKYSTRDRLSLGLTTEKDPGEAFFNGKNKNGFDFYSGYIRFSPNRVIKNITLGDFLVHSGQGLVFWQGYGFGKSENVLQVTKVNQGSRPSTSAEENKFFRGVCMEAQGQSSKLVAFLSSRKVDANLVTKEGMRPYFTSLQTSGYHRTSYETEDKDAVGDLNAGLIFTQYLEHFNFGFSYSFQKFSHPYIPQDRIHNRYRFQGKQNNVLGSNYQVLFQKLQLSGELAVSQSGGIGMVQGGQFYLSDQLNISAFFRHFDRDYHAGWANPLSERSSANNETGLYLGVQLIPFRFATISTYVDHFQSRWLTYTSVAPSSGWEQFFQIKFTLRQGMEFYLRSKVDMKDGRSVKNKVYVQEESQRFKNRFHIQYEVSDFLILKTRLENVVFRKNISEHGYLIFQDIHLRSKNKIRTVNFRLAWFNTDSYQTRIYAYENDLLYAFSVPSFFGKGIKTYVNLRYGISERTDIWLKFANTRWNDREQISSGHNLIEGRDKTELKLQLRLKF